MLFVDTVLRLVNCNSVHIALWCKRNKALNKHTKLFMAEKDG